MKFRKGNLVEVLRREDDPCGSWYTANILSAHGDSYIIQYKLFTDREGNRVAANVQGMDVRPLPPYVNGKNWAVGDVAEVFDVQCWRIGKVAKVLKNHDSFVIKLFGSIQLKEFHASSLRVRQAWHGNKWMVVGKVAGSKDLNNNFTPKIPYRAGCLCFKTPLQNKDGADKATMCLSMRAIHKVYAHQSEEFNIEKHFGGKLMTRKSPHKRTHPLFNRVDEFSYRHAGINEKFIKLTKTNNRMEDTNPNFVYHSSSPAWYTENSDQCSVASCSFNGVADFGGWISPKSSENIPDHSDAESSFPSLCVKRNLPSSHVDKVVNIHELERHAYKSTVEALYVSGPLTWEQEEMLTNLRLSLNISDDEHLLQLRHLLSAHVL
ncbi:hypothetical protein F3Y22_tig00116951pilonHSYRG00639 [Hibiscus syriacus]|uniref:ENT domain-containing protein n=1 Tax=Hibiscus syriacus TaxID=106335 RepID=A0A6A2XWI8_HIBSY|nr:uncharacterized protein LOC120189168 isoform X1 [Hibiscus syriacus]XP_039048438.1 uncharacterized protein LOC120189168 isoform X1 [Hibiscus syriacus]XP_039048439.1 uncharacterized protein LOC120189168 isoform X1 [Hibiscus syriacus]KAE8660677.1 hypothetical protein F3Y22_tig00116951pilonHSYRG00639 [Hibiscus syriacus]